MPINFNIQVGRSGRFGHLGLAVNLITYEDRFNLYESFSYPFVDPFFCHIYVNCTSKTWASYVLILTSYPTGIGLSKNWVQKSSKFHHILIRQFTAGRLWLISCCVTMVRNTNLLSTIFYGHCAWERMFSGLVPSKHEEYYCFFLKLGSITLAGYHCLYYVRSSTFILLEGIGFDAPSISSHCKSDIEV